jgi:hypothetical protein
MLAAGVGVRLGRRPARPDSQSSMNQDGARHSLRRSQHRSFGMTGCGRPFDHGTVVVSAAALISAGISCGRIQPSSAERIVATANFHTKSL